VFLPGLAPFSPIGKKELNSCRIPVVSQLCFSSGAISLHSTPDLAPAFYAHYVEVTRKLLSVERQTAVRLRNQRRISDELLREFERELDLSESKFAKGS
jgi:hypothetical protein